MTTSQRERPRDVCRRCECEMRGSDWALRFGLWLALTFLAIVCVSTWQHVVEQCPTARSTSNSATYVPLFATPRSGDASATLPISNSRPSPDQETVISPVTKLGG